MISSLLLELFVVVFLVLPYLIRSRPPPLLGMLPADLLPIMVLLCLSLVPFRSIIPVPMGAFPRATSAAVAQLRLWQPREAALPVKISVPEKVPAAAVAFDALAAAAAAAAVVAASPCERRPKPWGPCWCGTARQGPRAAGWPAKGVTRWS